MQPLVKLGQGDYIRTIEAREIIDTPASRLAAMHARVRRRRCIAGLVATLVALGVASACVTLPQSVWLAVGVIVSGLFIVFYPAP